MGATLAVDLNHITLKEVMAQLNMREGFDVGLEMSGHPGAFSQMINHLNHAGKVALLGFLPSHTEID